MKVESHNRKRCLIGPSHTGPATRIFGGSGRFSKTEDVLRKCLKGLHRSSYSRN